MTEVGRLARSSLGQASPWCDPSLAILLAEHEWRRLGGHPDPHSYSSSAFLSDKLQEDCIGVVGPGRISSAVRVHSFRHGFPARYSELGMVGCPLEPHAIVGRLGEALDLIRLVAAASDSVLALVRVIHPLRLDHPDYDVSYSDPLLPFSIFVGVPNRPGPYAPLRMAESLLHEAMHLQLSLVERHVPLVQPRADDRLHSPWRDAGRPIGGVLHGLYVFRAIHDFMEELASDERLASEDRTFCAIRAASIRTEIAAVGGLRNHPALTNDGARLAGALLRPGADAGSPGAVARAG